MRAVSNTSPISNLAIIGRLSLLRQRYGRVVVPFFARANWRYAVANSLDAFPGGVQR